MATENTQPSEAYLVAAAFGREVELRHIGTVKIGAGFDQPPMALAALAEAGGGRIELHAEQKYAFDGKESQLTAEIAFRVGVAPPDPSAAAVYHVEATFVLVYGVRTPPPESERAKTFEAFVTVNGTYNAWPYLREVLSSMSARLGAPPVLLPVFRSDLVGKHAAATSTER